MTKWQATPSADAPEGDAHPTMTPASPPCSSRRSERRRRVAMALCGPPSPRRHAAFFPRGHCQDTHRGAPGGTSLGRASQAGPSRGRWRCWKAVLFRVAADALCTHSSLTVSFDSAEPFAPSPEQRMPAGHVFLLWGSFFYVIQVYPACPEITHSPCPHPNSAPSSGKGHLVPNSPLRSLAAGVATTAMATAGVPMGGVEGPAHK